MICVSLKKEKIDYDEYYSIPKKKYLMFIGNFHRVSKIPLIEKGKEDKFVFIVFSENNNKQMNNEYLLMRNNLCYQY